MPKGELSCKRLQAPFSMLIRLYSAVCRRGKPDHGGLAGEVVAIDGEPGPHEVVTQHYRILVTAGQHSADALASIRESI